MNIDHIGIWARNLELLKCFYVEHFNAKTSEKYINPKKGFSSYFLTFGSGAKLELMHSVNHCCSNASIHFAFSVGSESQVDKFYESAKLEGIHVITPPRHTGDGYYELLISDPENNRIEITI